MIKTKISLAVLALTASIAIAPAAFACSLGAGQTMYYGQVDPVNGDCGPSHPLGIVEGTISYDPATEWAIGNDGFGYKVGGELVNSTDLKIVYAGILGSYYAPETMYLHSVQATIESAPGLVYAGDQGYPASTDAFKVYDRNNQNRNLATAQASSTALSGSGVNYYYAFKAGDKIPVCWFSTNPKPEMTKTGKQNLSISKAYALNSKVLYTANVPVTQAPYADSSPGDDSTVAKNPVCYFVSPLRDAANSRSVAFAFIGYDAGGILTPDKW